MNNIILFLLAILSWGTSWYAIKFQLGIVPSELSVSYRFLLAGFILFIVSKVMKQNVGSIKNHFFALLQGVFLFCLNYLLIYNASKYLNSGVCALSFSLLGLFNILNARLFLKQKMNAIAITAGFISTIGLVFVFWQDLLKIESGWLPLLGLSLSIGSAFVASIGNIIAIKGKDLQIPVIALSAYGMMYGGSISLIYSLASGQSLVFDFRPSYLISLGFLVIFATVLAFLAYLTLLRRLGAAKAAYVVYGYPVIAIIVSSIFEGYHITSINFVGFLLVLGGNFMILKSKKTESLIIHLRKTFTQKSKSFLFFTKRIFLKKYFMKTR